MYVIIFLEEIKELILLSVCHFSLSAADYNLLINGLMYAAFEPYMVSLDDTSDSAQVTYYFKSACEHIRSRSYIKSKDFDRVSRTASRVEVVCDSFYMNTILRSMVFYGGIRSILPADSYTDDYVREIIDRFDLLDRNVS